MKSTKEPDNAPNPNQLSNSRISNQITMCNKNVWLLFPWCGLAARLALREWPYEFSVAKNLRWLVWPLQLLSRNQIFLGSLKIKQDKEKRFYREKRKKSKMCVQPPWIEHEPPPDNSMEGWNPNHWTMEALSYLLKILGFISIYKSDSLREENKSGLAQAW